ncbi:helix-turn-helix domain-containing protein [Streptomyces sp. NPDC051662]|uniref:helix-turn-helix domain-containing protein n=1 Tax=Streptomyces sp. NPDC051662 TaxID=3154750 RepID=UPI00343C310C
MRKPILPDNAELLKREALGMSRAEIAAEFGVSRQAVAKRFNDMGKYSRGPIQDVTAALPWDIANHPAKKKLWAQQPYLGLRAFLRQRMGAEVSQRSQLALRAFLNHVVQGEVLDLHETQGAHYVPRDPERDGELVIRWPRSVPLDDERKALFRLKVVEAPPES